MDSTVLSQMIVSGLTSEVRLLPFLFVLRGQAESPKQQSGISHPIH